MLTQPATVSMPTAMASIAPASPTKKRRRRAPATGAAEDCFTCRSSAIKCDRRRPYCGPCLDQGVGCKGYRTQLTWGVGVASRGKLRGMSTPVANSPQVEREVKKPVKKKTEDKETMASENGISKSKKVKSSSNSSNGSYDSRNGASNVGKLSIITSYDFVNMEPPSTGSSGISRNSSVLSANNSSITSTGGSVLSAISRSGMPQRIGQAQRSPQSSTNYSPYSANSHNYHSPIPQHQQYQTPVSQYHKSPFSHVSLPPQQPTPSLLLSPMSEYEPSFPNAQHYPMTSAPSNTPLYDMVTGVSSGSYHPSMTVTSTGMSYAPMVAPMHATSRMIDDGHHSVHHHHGGHWHGVGMASGVGNLHHQHVTAGGNLSDLLYDDDMLAAAAANLEFSFSAPNYNSLPAPHAPIHISTSHAFATTSAQPPALPPLAIQPPLPPPQLVNLSPQLRFLIDYYDKTVCPSVVAFDGPTNPYRKQILGLAFYNEALMEAVYALANSHLHSTQKTALLLEQRNSSRSSSSRSWTRSNSPIPPNSPANLNNRSNVAAFPSRSPPDIYRPPSLPSVAASIAKKTLYSTAALNHKNASIRLLNNQLANPVLAATDSAMATLLLLLLYHICETGIGQFKTHLAGVKKLMGMRSVGRETQKWGWMETVFTWLDNMSASVNNREAQLGGGCLDMIVESDDEWGLESLTGCDRDLFMRLAGLGRINMLSQMAPTNYDKAYIGDYNVDDDDMEPARNENDGRDDFWMAWNAMKADLVEWKPTVRYAATPFRHKSSPACSGEFDFSSFSSSGVNQCSSPTSSAYSISPPPPSSLAGSPLPKRKSLKAHEAVETNHWLHASNVNRHAAVLYLDRLAYPHLPSSHSIFQNTVREVIDHVNCVPTTGLGSRLLWPLFVVGTECVVDAHKSLIRERCLDMQRDCGFFNKASGLEVLEKIWSDDAKREEEEGEEGEGEESVNGYCHGGGARAREMKRRDRNNNNQSIGGRGLRWRRVTDLEDAEYLMI